MIVFKKNSYLGILDVSAVVAVNNLRMMPEIREQCVPVVRSGRYIIDIKISYIFESWVSETLVISKTSFGGPSVCCVGVDGKWMGVYTGDSKSCGCVGAIVCSAVLQLMNGQQVAHS